MMFKLAATAALAIAVGAASPAGAQEPLAIAKQGYFFVGGKYATAGDKQVLTGQAYVEYQIPTAALPALSAGDRAGRGADRNQFYRHGGRPRGLGAVLPAPRLCGLHRRAAGPRALRLSARHRRAASLSAGPRMCSSALPHRRNTRCGRSRACIVNGRGRAWPAIRSSTSSWPRRCRSYSAPEVTQTLNRDALAALIDKLGPVILMVHSQAGAYGLLAADARPQWRQGADRGRRARRRRSMTSNSSARPTGSAMAPSASPGA